MSSIAEEVFRDTGELLPNNVGEAYNKVTKLGSWVTSGINAYYTATQEFNELKRYLKRWDNLKEDPTVLFYTINSILRENPVKMPDHLSGEDQNMIRKLVKSLFGGNRGRNLRDQLQREYNNGGKLINRPEDNLGSTQTRVDVVSRRDNLTTFEPYFDPYNNTNFEVNSVEDAIKKLDDAGYKLGQQYVRNFEIGSINQWYISIKPYISNTSGRDFTLTPELPKYMLPDLDGGQSRFINEYSFGDPCPVRSWNLQWGTLTSDRLSLFNGSELNIPTGFRYDMVLTLNILDDVHMSMDKYMRGWMNSIYNISRSEMAPYWASAFEVTLTIFKPGYHINYKFPFICVPSNWAPSFAGSSDNTDEASVQIDFSVVGFKIPTNSNAKVMDGVDNTLSISNPAFDWTWNDITLNPTGNDILTEKE